MKHHIDNKNIEHNKYNKNQKKKINKIKKDNY